MPGSHDHRKASSQRKVSRRTVSVYDKMQEARARRAALLEGREPANLPTAAPAQPDPAAVPTAPEPDTDRITEELRSIVVDPMPPTEADPVPARRKAVLPFIIWALVLTLVGLVSLALFQLRTAELPPSPVLASEPLPPITVSGSALTDFSRPAPFMRPTRSAAPGGISRPSQDPAMRALDPPVFIPERKPIHISEVDLLTSPPPRPEWLSARTDDEG